MDLTNFMPSFALHLLLLSGLAATSMGQWPHHVYREDWKERSCRQILRHITHSHVTAEVPPRLNGQWASYRCEIRSGPQFVLRSYNFDGARFESRLYHYEDADCNRPLYALLATGTLQLLQESWVVPGTMDGDFRLEQVQLVAYSASAARWLHGLLTSSCPSTFSPSLPLRPLRHYTVLHYFWPDPGAPHSHNGSSTQQDSEGSERPRLVKKTDGSHDFDCTQLLNFTLNELQLIRLETRLLRPPLAAARLRHKRHSRPGQAGLRKPGMLPKVKKLKKSQPGPHKKRQKGRRHRPGSVKAPRQIPGRWRLPRSPSHAKPGGSGSARISGNGGEGKGHWGHVQRELLLGDVHTEPTERQSHRPSSFQDPLRDTQAASCGVCSKIGNSDELDPPRLAVHQGTLLSLEGEWVSTRCESRQYGQFLTRWLHFLSDGQSWEGRYDYYHDALCRQPAFTLRAKGSYAGGHESEVIKGSKAYSFKTTKLKVTPHSAVTVNTLNTYQGKFCGQAGQWTQGREQDVSRTEGCVTLGIRLPALEQDLVRMEAAHRRLLLYVSQRSSDRPLRPYHLPPPAAFQPPLAQCDQRDLDMSINSLPGEEGPPHHPPPFVVAHAHSSSSRLQEEEKRREDGAWALVLSSAAGWTRGGGREIGAVALVAAGVLVVRAVVVVTQAP